MVFWTVWRIAESSSSARLKENAAFSVEAEISASKGNIRADQMISLPGSGKNAKALGSFAAWWCGMKPESAKSCS